MEKMRCKKCNKKKNCKCKDKKKNKKKLQADIKTLDVVYDTLNQTRSGATVPDTIIAVGPEVYIVVTNTAFAVFNKSNNQELYYSRLEPFFNGAYFTDPYILYDTISERFFMSEWSFVVTNAVIIGPNGEQYNGSKGSSYTGSFEITSKLVLANPPGAETALINAAEMNGNIALIGSYGFATGGSVSSATKVRNAFNAGAVGVIIYETTRGDGTNIAGTADIPSIAVDDATGQKLLQILGQIVTMKSLPSSTINNILYMAVSKSSSPKTINDWNKYSYINNDILYRLTDYPKLAINQNQLYWVTNDFVTTGGAFLSGHITIFDKSKFLDGTGFVLVKDINLPDGDAAPWPLTTTFPLIDDKIYPQFFVSYNIPEETEIYIYTMTDPYNGIYKRLSIPFPTKMTFSGKTFLEQPKPSDHTDISYPLYNSIGLSNGIRYKDSLWTTIQWSPDSNTATIRWFELDVNKILNDDPNAIIQWGDMNPCDGKGFDEPLNSSHINYTANTAGFQNINVDIDGNMSITATISGDGIYPSACYTGRLKTDPLGTLRYPYQIPAKSEYSYNSSLQQFRANMNFNRWCDYTGLVVDPVDNKTFYYFQEIPDHKNGVNYSSKVTNQWSTVVLKYQINAIKSKEDLGTYPANSCICDCQSSYVSNNQQNLRINKQGNIINKDLMKYNDLIMCMVDLK